MPEHEQPGAEQPESGRSSAAQEAYKHLGEHDQPTEVDLLARQAEAQQLIAEAEKEKRMSEMEAWSDRVGYIAGAKAEKQAKIIASTEEILKIPDAEIVDFAIEDMRTDLARNSQDLVFTGKGRNPLGVTDTGDVQEHVYDNQGRPIRVDTYRSPANMGEPAPEADAETATDK